MYKPGDRVRVVARDEYHCNDYIEGDIATVVQASEPYLWVKWETNILGANEDSRVSLLFVEEVELVP